MKNFNHLCIVLVLLSISLSCFAQPIKMYGRWNTRQKSIIQDIPIGASIDENSKELTLQFYKNLGLVYVTVSNCSGEVVYREPIDTKDIPSFIIQLDATAKEECMLSITDGRNEVSGTFVVY